MNEHEIKEVSPEVAPKKKSGPKPKAKVEAVQAAPIEMPKVLTAEEQRRKDLRDRILREKAHKAKLVTGKFLFNECPGGLLEFSFREFPGDQLVKYSMRHDTIHTVPLGVAQHLNKRCAYPEYQHNMDNGKSVDAKALYIQSKVHRTSFIPLDFTEDTDYNNGNSIAQVTYTNPNANKFSLDSLGR